MKDYGDAFKKIAIFVLSTTKPNGKLIYFNSVLQI
jgi:hypothetical protein